MRSVFALAVAILALTSTVAGIRKKSVRRMKPLLHAGGHGQSVHVDSGDWATGPLPYNGGLVKTGQTPVYLIFYGNWDADSSAVPLFTTFLNGIGSTPWWGISKLYKDSKGDVAGSGGFVVKGTYDDLYSDGSAIDMGIIENAIYLTLSNHSLPVDPSALYVFLTSDDVAINGFCNSWCAYHTYTYYDDGSVIQYAVIGNPASQCIKSCSINTDASPNGNPGVDSMLNSLAHEIAGFVSDPNQDGWTFKNGTENADLCNGNFGITKTLPTGAFYNIAFAGLNWLVQKMWNPNTNQCVMSA